MGEEALAIISCDHIGISGTTDVAVRQIGPQEFEARVGIAIMGSCDHEWLDEHPEATPFDEDFHDNYAVGKGPTREDAIKALKEDMKKTSEGLWA